MKIEMIVPTLEVGGMETMTVSLAGSLKRAGHDVGVTCLNFRGPLASRLLDVGIRVSLVRAPGLRSSFWAPGLVRHLRTLRPDVVHTHSGVWGRACRAARMAGVDTTVHTVHGKLDSDPFYDIVLKRWEARHSTHIVAVSEALEQDLVDRVGLRPQNISVIENGIDTATFIDDPADRQRMREELEIEDRMVIGVVARLAAVKNLHALITAFRDVMARMPAAYLLLAGDGPLWPDLSTHVARLGLSGAVRFLGTRNDTPRIHRALDLFVLPSLAEGTSISLLEAMASRTPVIATPVGNNAKVLGHGKLGRLTRSPAASDLAQEMLAVINDWEPSVAKASAAQAAVKQHYSVDTMRAHYEQLYGK